MSTDRTRRTLAHALAIAAATLALLALGGCPGTLDLGPFHDASVATDDGAAPEAASSCPDVPTTILGPQCAKAGCHVGAAAAGGVDLTAAGIAALPGKSDPNCGGLFVDPAHADKSALYLKLLASPPCGARMPSGAPPLSDSDQQCVLTWIKTLPAATADAGGD
jgi:hypothetical protein